MNCQCSHYKNLSCFKLDNLCLLHNYYQLRVFIKILEAGERCNVTGEYFETGSTSEYNVVIGYQTFAGELSIVNGEFSNL